MADLLTHLVAARVPGGLIRDPRFRALLVLGTFLPDLASKGLYWLLWTREHFQEPTHSILGVLLLSYLASLFLEEGLRRAGFALIWAGGLIHIGVDLAKDNLGAGSARLWIPFSMAGTELGWIHQENVVLLIPIDLAILLGVWLLERRIRHVQQ